MTSMPETADSVGHSGQGGFMALEHQMVFLHIQVIWAVLDTCGQE